MAETISEDLKRCVHFGPLDESALRRLPPERAPQVRPITEAFCQRIDEQAQGMGLLLSDAQAQCLQIKLCEWLELLSYGPGDDAYVERRARVGLTQVMTALPQHCVFAALSLIRGELMRGAEHQAGDQRGALQNAVNKLLDMERAITLEGHRQACAASVANVGNVRTQERREHDHVARSPWHEEAHYAELVEETEALICTCDHVGRIVLLNAKCEQITGVSRHAARGRSWLEMFVAVADREKVARRRLARVRRHDPENVVKAMALAEGEMKRLAALVRDFVLFASPQPLRLAQVELQDIARAVVDLVAPEAKERAVQVQLECCAPVAVEADEEKVKQVLLNPLRNAIEATGPEGRVVVRVRQVAAIGEIIVEDDGPGWDADAPIFGPFVTTKDMGTGLIVMDQGGTLDADTGPGRTTFQVQLPRAHPSAALARESRPDQQLA